MKYDKIKIKNKLREKLNREPSDKELGNAETDANLVNELLADEIEDLKKRVSKLEKP